jgi:hypothetical protein
MKHSAKNGQYENDSDSEVEDIGNSKKGKKKHFHMIQGVKMKWLGTPLTHFLPFTNLKALLMV